MTIELENVVRRIGAETHIHETSVRFAETGFNVLLGETRAGKTTLIKLIAGLDRPTSGTIRIKGRDVTGLSTQKRNISLVHQFFVNYPNMNVFENIASPLRVAGVGRKERKRRVEEAAELMRLTPMLKRRPSELSGGQQQRTITSCARNCGTSCLVSWLDAARLSSMPLRNRTRRCCSAGIPQR